MTTTTGRASPRVIDEPWATDAAQRRRSPSALADAGRARRAHGGVDARRATGSRPRSRSAPPGVPASVVASPGGPHRPRPGHERVRVCGRPRTTREMGDVRVDGIPVHFSETDWSIERGGPCLGEHNRRGPVASARPRRRRDRAAARGRRRMMRRRHPSHRRARSTASRSSSWRQRARRVRGQAARRPRRRRDRRRTARRSPEPRLRALRRRRSRTRSAACGWWNYNTSKRSVVLDLDTPTAPSSSAGWPPTPTSCSRASRPERWPTSGIDHDDAARRSPRADLGLGHAVRARHVTRANDPATDLTLLAAAARSGAAGTTTTRSRRCAAAATRRSTSAARSR